MEEKEEIIFNVCSVCDKIKPLSEFHRDKTKYLGRSTTCKKCGAVRNKKYRQTENGRLVEKRKEHKRRAREQGSKVDLTSDQWQRILKNQCYKCNICSKKFCKSRPPTIDHVVPLSKGGDLTSCNVQALCASCNSSKGAKVLKTFIISWLDI